MSEHTFHTNMRFVLSEQMILMKICTVRTYVEKAYFYSSSSGVVTLKIRSRIPNSVQLF